MDSRKGIYYHDALNFLQSKVVYRLVLPPMMPENHNAFRADMLIYNVLRANQIRNTSTFPTQTNDDNVGVRGNIASKINVYIITMTK